MNRHDLAEAIVKELEELHKAEGVSRKQIVNTIVKTLKDYDNRCDDCGAANCGLDPCHSCHGNYCEDCEMYECERCNHVLCGTCTRLIGDEYICDGCNYGLEES